jgi:CRISPR-associated protein Csb2
MILHLTIRFLDARYHGRGDAGEPEWPPSPFRVFQALLAGAKSQWSADRGEAFKWLESLSPPVIHAPTGRLGDTLLTYVPNNHNTDPRQISRTAKLIRPRILPEDRPCVDYLWTFADTAIARQHAKTIADCARQIRCVGWGIDMAIGHGAISEQSPCLGEGVDVHAPAQGDDYGGALTRVPSAGSLDSLERAHDQFLHRIRTNPDTGQEEIHDHPGTERFDVRAYAASPLRPYCAFDLNWPDEEERQISFDPRRIKALVGMIRGLLGSPRVRKNPELPDKVDTMFLGHVNDPSDPRLAILPLLSVGHRHADARVRRVILAEPYGSDGTVCRLLAELLNGQMLTPIGPDPSPVARLVRLRHDDPYVRAWYTRSATQWASVSPVLLPGFDHRVDKRGDKPRPQKGVETFTRAEKLVLKSLAHAGITLPCKVELSPVSWWPGVPHARSFVPREKLGSAPRYHVKLTFDQPFAGPLSLGRQRNTGLGVFAAINGK